MCKLRAMRVKRCVLFIAVAALFLNVLGCYGTWIVSSQARECCGAGHCSPSKGDPCCQASAAGFAQALLTPEKTSVQQPVTTIAPLLACNSIGVRIDYDSFGWSSADAVHHPPPPGIIDHSLPLLI